MCNIQIYCIIICIKIKIKIAIRIKVVFYPPLAAVSIKVYTLRRRAATCAAKPRGKRGAARLFPVAKNAVRRVFARFPLCGKRAVAARLRSLPPKALRDILYPPPYKPQK